MALPTATLASWIRMKDDEARAAGQTSRAAPNDSLVFILLLCVTVA